MNATLPSLHVCGLVAYDGTDYHGFQVQRGVATIQASLESALAAFADVRSRVAGAGRTDTGVHAVGQVIAVQVAWKHAVEDLQRAWNAHLPPSIAVRNVQLAPAGFQPRFSAVSRTYRYTIVHPGAKGNRRHPSRSPLTDRYALYETKPLDLAALRQATAYLVGTHDFATFGQPPQGESTVRNVLGAEWQVTESDLPVLSGYPRQQIMFTVTANAFLRQMVRNLVGTLLEVGRGRWTPEAVQQALAARNRSRCAQPAPPQGLTLEAVEYPKHLNLFGNN